MVWETPTAAPCRLLKLLLENHFGNSSLTWTNGLQQKLLSPTFHHAGLEGWSEHRLVDQLGLATDLGSADFTTRATLSGHRDYGPSS